MGNSGSVWVPLVGLGFLAGLTAVGMVGALILANNGHDVPPWLSSTITGLATNFGVIVLVVYKGNGGGQPAAK